MTEESTGASSSKFNLIPGEGLLYATRPSFFAFFSWYLLAILVVGIHMLWGWYSTFDAGDEAAAWAEILDLWVAGGTMSFFVTILILLWINRMANLGSSGVGFSILLLIIAALPGLFGMMELLSEGWLFIPGVLDENPLPFGWTDSFYYLFGGIWGAVLILYIVMYQRSFQYAITDKALVFKRDFLMTRAQRRVLYDNINDLTLQQGASGTLFGFGTVTPITASGIGMGESGGGIAAAAGTDMAETLGGKGDDAKSKAKCGVLKMVFAVLSFQRSKKQVMPDPGEAFYGVRNPQRVYDKVAEQWSAHDPASKMGEIKDLLAAQAQQAQAAPAAAPAEQPPQQ